MIEILQTESLIDSEDKSIKKLHSFSKVLMRKSLEVHKVVIQYHIADCRIKEVFDHLHARSNTLLGF